MLLDPFVIHPVDHHFAHATCCAHGLHRSWCAVLGGWSATCRLFMRTLNSIRLAQRGFRGWPVSRSPAGAPYGAHQGFLDPAFPPSANGQQIQQPFHPSIRWQQARAGRAGAARWHLPAGAAARGNRTAHMRNRRGRGDITGLLPLGAGEPLTMASPCPCRQHAENHDIIALVHHERGAARAAHPSTIIDTGTVTVDGHGTAPNVWSGAALPPMTRVKASFRQCMVCCYGGSSGVRLGLAGRHISPRLGRRRNVNWTDIAMLAAKPSSPHLLQVLAVSRL